MKRRWSNGMASECLIVSWINISASMSVQCERTSRHFKRRNHTAGLHTHTHAQQKIRAHTEKKPLQCQPKQSRDLETIPCVPITFSATYISFFMCTVQRRHGVGRWASYSSPIHSPKSIPEHSSFTLASCRHWAVQRTFKQSKWSKLSAHVLSNFLEIQVRPRAAWNFCDSVAQKLPNEQVWKYEKTVKIPSRCREAKLSFANMFASLDSLWKDWIVASDCVINTSPFRLDPRGWEPHFVATERRPQGALLTSWQNPTFTEEGFCYKMAVQADP